MKTTSDTQIIITVSSGRGPAECERAVVLFADWLRHSLSTGPGLASDCRILEEKPGLMPDTRASICLEIDTGNGIAAKALRARLEGLTGTVQWICPSPYRPGHRRKNWFIQVNLGSAVPEANQGIDINPADVRFETARSSGKGGQHVNKTETAVRAVHLPTGLVAISRDERSQLSNKKTALLRLGQRLAEQAAQSRLRQKARLRNQHDQLERGNAVASFTGPDFNPLPKHQAQDNHEY